jgi:hypothetical protein
VTRRPVAWTALVVAAAAALFLARARQRVDPDLFFHLKHGAVILSERAVPAVERYSYTRAGREIVLLEWLACVAYFAAFSAGGYLAVAAFSALLLAGALALTARTWDDGAPEEARALGAALVAFGFLPFALAKTQSFTILLFALFLLWVRRWEQGRRWAPWAMAASLAVWVNLHAGFMLGWGLLGAACVLDFARERRAAALAPWAAGTFACFLHPNGATAFVYPFWMVFAAPPGRGAIVEWTPLNWSRASALPYALLILAAALARIDRARGRFPWALAAAALLAAGLRSRKMLPYFALAAYAAAGRVQLRAALGAARARWCLAGAAAILLSVGAIEAREARALAPLGPASDWEREYPRAGAEEIAARFPGRRLFHPFDWGGYLIYKLAPRTKVFIDGRLDPYWNLLDDYGALMEAQPGWRRLADAYGIEVALLPTDAPLARALAADADWKLSGADARTVLYSRRSLTPAR